MRNIPHLVNQALFFTHYTGLSEKKAKGGQALVSTLSQQYLQKQTWPLKWVFSF